MTHGAVGRDTHLSVELHLVGLHDDAVLIVTDKFSKFIKIVIGRTDWTSEDWAHTYLTQVYSDWGMPDVFIRDVDPSAKHTLQPRCHVSPKCVTMPGSQHNWQLRE